MPANDIPQLVRSIEQIVAEMGAAPDAWAMGNVGPRVEAIRRWRQVARETLDGIDALAALQSPPPREADAALWPLVEQLQAHARECGWQDVDEPIAALLAYRPPSAPTPAVTPYDFEKEARIVCEAIGSDNGRMTVQCALREAFAAALASPPPPETQP